MEWVTMLDVWTSKSFVGNDYTSPRLIFNITWHDAKGESHHFSTQAFYHFAALYKELAALYDEDIDPRDNDFMIEHYSNEPQYVVV